jgi:putative transposase
LTVLTAERQHPIQYPAVVAPLRHVFAWTKARISIDAIVLHPDHLHRAWTIPRSDADYCRRWRAIKQCFAICIEALVSELDEKPICQRWFREHLIPDDDMREHLKQIQYNSVRHALVNTPEDWPYSTFTAAIEKEWHPQLRSCRAKTLPAHAQ